MKKVNLHAHTRYSDGHNTIEEMVEEYQRNHFSCAVITDHFYHRGSKYSIDMESMKRAREEAYQLQKKKGYPVIVGIEHGLFKEEEILCWKTTSGD